MASIPYAVGTDRDEARFFFTMSCLMAATIIAGFSVNILTGRSSFGMPWLVHLHAWVMMGWLALYVVQNALIFGGNVALHRRLGWLSLLFLPAMLIMGLLITRYSLQALGGPSFFDQNQFLVSNPLQLAGVVIMVLWALALRRNTSWHRRLMFCGFAALTGPGFGRLLPSPLFIPYAWYVVAVLPAVLFPAVGMFADRRRYGAVHPAWFWGIGIVIGMQVLADLIAYSPFGDAFTFWFLSGTPGAARPMEAFFPSA